MMQQNKQHVNPLSKITVRLNLFIVGLMLLPIYIKFMDVLSQLLSFPTTITTYIYYGALWILLITSFPKTLLKNFNKAGIPILCIVCLIMFELELYPTSRIFIFDKDIFNIIAFQTTAFLSSAVFLFVGLCVTDFEQLSETMYKGARIGIVVAVLTYLLMLFGGLSIHYDDMGTAYAISLLLCILISNAQKHDLAFIIIGSVCLILAGTRGPILCVLIAVLFKCFIFEDKFTRKVGCVVLCIIIGVLIYKGIGIRFLEGFSNILSGFGVKNLRILDYVNDEMLFDSSSRDDFAKLLIDAIKQHPFIGYGIGADRYLLRGSYAHNMIIESILSLGIIGGVVFIAWFFSISFKILTSENLCIKKIGIGLFCGVVVKLMLSSSMIISKEFFLFIGICLASEAMLKEEKNKAEKGEIHERIKAKN
jgi:O-antigen ligase